MKLHKFDEEAVYAIADCLFGTNMSIDKIASSIGRNPTYVQGVIKDMNWDWARTKSRKMSRGATSLTALFKKLLPGQEIVNEFHVGERLMLDVYCPKYKIGAEYHGSQHFQYNTMFHENNSEFIKGQIRDQRKIELCKQQGISLVVFRYNDVLDEVTVSERIIDAVRNSDCEPIKGIKKRPTKKNEFYEVQQERRRQAWRKGYRDKKLNRKNERY
jgi:hypothetical protein